ncbi:hemerythrin superfamily protein [Variovorax boronicumulans]|uniref:Hemerythrin superfamily protein n=1 Tax=Variovorax boronicumulans TaxID=436515 RepID=A0AAW8DU97_9BURK|nr:hemerythrin domain-containing protein [Variovorax boronicumulans]MDP9877748.1 hemerythrin superfamily protein [Variovorax boronicumulans]MDP9923031.1 hemerythrin superfamily protein [Variovorax boronicumulans]
MTKLFSPLFPSATNMVRLDHTHVLSTFHQYRAQSPSRVKKGLANTLCTALEVHAQLEEEIFYPAVRAVTQDDVIAESLGEHQEMRRLIGKLRQMEPDDPGYDPTVADLMRDVMHHVADEETRVLPEAERLLADQLGELGMQMTKRRLQLMGPRSGEIALDMGRAVSGHTLALAMLGVTAMGLLVARRGGHLDLSRLRLGKPG